MHIGSEQIGLEEQNKLKGIVEFKFDDKEFEIFKIVFPEPKQRKPLQHKIQNGRRRKSRSANLF